MRKLLILLLISILFLPAKGSNAAPLWDLKVGEVWEYSRTDTATSSSWKTEIEVLDEVSIGPEMYFHVKWSNENNLGEVDYQYWRFTETEMYGYDGISEFLFMQLGPVGTNWDAGEDHFEITDTNYSVTVPYGGPYNAHEIYVYDTTEVINPTPYWYMYIVPGLGLVKDVDFFHDNTPAPRIMELVQIHPIPEPATMLLLGSGFIGLAGARRKFKK